MVAPEPVEVVVLQAVEMHVAQREEGERPGLISPGRTPHAAAATQGQGQRGRLKLAAGRLSSHAIPPDSLGPDSQVGQDTTLDHLAGGPAGPGPRAGEGHGRPGNFSLRPVPRPAANQPPCPGRRPARP